MNGTVVQVSISSGGVPKRAVARAKVEASGLRGDGWAHPEIHGGPTQSLLIIAEEVLEELKEAGFPVFPGALGENLTTRGLPPDKFRIGQIYRAGSARLEFTKLRAPCATLRVYGANIAKAIYDRAAASGDIDSPFWGKSGMYARVLAEGMIAPGDRIELESELA